MAGALGCRVHTDILRNLRGSKPEGGAVQHSHFVAMVNKVSGRDMV